MPGLSHLQPSIRQQGRWTVRRLSLWGDWLPGVGCRERLSFVTSPKHVWNYLCKASPCGKPSYPAQNKLLQRQKRPAVMPSEQWNLSLTWGAITRIQWSPKIRDHSLKGLHFCIFYYTLNLSYSLSITVFSNGLCYKEIQYKKSLHLSSHVERQWQVTARQKHLTLTFCKAVTSVMIEWEKDGGLCLSDSSGQAT